MSFDPVAPVCVLVMSPGRMREALETELSVDGFDVRCADSIAAAEARMTPRLPSIVVVGLLEDRAAAYALLRGLREGRLLDGRLAPEVPAVAIVADRELSSLLRAFECGADDVVGQPVRYAELRARMRALLRRVDQRAEPAVRRIGELTIDYAARTATVAGEDVALTRKEWELLVCLASEPGRVFTKLELLREVWQTDVVARSRTLESHAQRLRAKLAAAGAAYCVLSVWGVGYRLAEPRTLAAA